MRIRSAHLGLAVTILLGLLLPRALLSRNPIEIRMGKNLVPSDNGHICGSLRTRWRAHGKLETHIPPEQPNPRPPAAGAAGCLVPVIRDSLRRGLADRLRCERDRVATARVRAPIRSLAHARVIAPSGSRHAPGVSQIINPIGRAKKNEPPQKARSQRFCLLPFVSALILLP